MVEPERWRATRGGASPRTMRRFNDRNGRVWEVVLGRASWGAHCALFVPDGWQADVRQAPLLASAWDHATAELESMDDARLQALLDASTLREE